jgi:hypothetical protein
MDELMLTTNDFKKRAKALWKSQKTMASVRYWKTGKRAGTVRQEAALIEFTEHEFGVWLWKKIGLNAIPCPYCGKPIDILSLTPDHVVPRSAGGRFSLDNMLCMCKDCNERKGNLSARAFEAILKFLQKELAPYDQNILLSRLKSAHAGSPSRFFRDKNKGSQKVSRIPPNPSLEFSEMPEF